MTRGIDVSVSSQDARVTLAEGDTPDAMAENINAAIQLLRDDIQRLSSAISKRTALQIVSGNHRLPMPASGIADVWVISDTATTGSSGANYHTLSLQRNGAAANAITYRTDRAEIPAYRGGCYLGSASVGAMDVLAVSIATTGAPTALTLANFSLFCELRES